MPFAVMLCQLPYPFPEPGRGGGGGSVSIYWCINFYFKMPMVGYVIVILTEEDLMVIIVDGKLDTKNFRCYKKSSQFIVEKFVFPLFFSFAHKRQVNRDIEIL